MLPFQALECLERGADTLLIARRHTLFPFPSQSHFLHNRKGRFQIVGGIATTMTRLIGLTCSPVSAQS